MQWEGIRRIPWAKKAKPHVIPSMQHSPKMVTILMPFLFTCTVAVLVLLRQMSQDSMMMKLLKVKRKTNAQQPMFTMQWTSLSVIQHLGTEGYVSKGNETRLYGMILCIKYKIHRLQNCFPTHMATLSAVLSAWMTCSPYFPMMSRTIPMTQGITGKGERK